MPATDPYESDPLDDGRVTYQPVGSSNVHSVGYKVETHTLFVRFKDARAPAQWGSVYAYLDVPSFLYLNLLQAGSKGTFLNQQVKGAYAYRRIA